MAPPPPPAPVDTNGLKSEGADLVQAQGFTGTGVKVGVLSDGVNSLATLEGNGDLPNNVMVLSGQAGMGDEGTAMLEIVHDLAPGAQLFFATAFTSEAQFATNIQSLAAAGCNIIVDDVTYFDEGVFQDTAVAQAVNTVTASGVLYFSSAANSGNLDSGTSGTWEGDFNGTGTQILVINTKEGKTVPVHKFDATHESDTITMTSSAGGPVVLQWSDTFSPAPCVDYDLFIMDSGLATILDSSTNRQNCTTGPQPVEIAGCSPPPMNVDVCITGNVIVVVLFANSGSGPSTRALHVDTERARISINTNGATFGHNAGASTLTVAATPAQTTIFTSGNQSPESYSSDGPRKIFFHPDGTAITPGNFLFSTNGGTTLSKVDFTAADCGQSAVSGFNPFCGTSAAAPTAAAIAALMLPANPSLPSAPVIAAMKSTALPAHSGFTTNTVGSGIVMANLAVNSILTPGISVAPGASSFGAQTIGSPSAQHQSQLTNNGGAPLTINSIALSGANSGDFSLTHTCPLSPSTLPANASCMLNTTFTPLAGGPRKTGIMISDNAPGSPHTLIVTGVGTSAGISPSSLTFAATTVGMTTAAQTVTLTNKGSATMNVWQIATLGTNAGDFLMSSNTCGITLAIGASCTVGISFKPTATGARSASLLFSDDGGGSPQNVLLTGTGQ